jgi:UDP-N-acetylglucosamine 2-epimerase (non-hydrolysing)
MPEEINRIVVDSVSDFLLAPSSDAVDNLIAEGRPSHSICLAGNVMVDTLLANLERAKERPIHQHLGLGQRPFLLLTLHRPSTVEDPVLLGSLIQALAELADEVDVVMPAHPRTRVRLEALDVDGLIVTPPLGYLDFVCLEATAALVVTDSGGVQEETTMLGVPCLTVRGETERPLTVTEGTNKVIGRDPQVVIAEARRVLEHGVEVRRPELWDGRASQRIADFLSQRYVSRP